MPLLLAVPLLVLLTLIVTIGYAAIAPALSDATTSWLRDAGVVARFFLGPVVDVTLKLTRWITHKIGEGFEDVARLGSTWFSALYQYADIVITNALEWPLWQWKFMRWLLFVEIPKLYRAIPHAATSVVHAVTTRIVRVERTVVRLPKLSKAAAVALVSAAVAKWIHPYLSMLRWLRAHFHALTAVLPHTVPLPTVPSIPNLWKRVRALEKKLAVPFGLGIVAAALARLGIGWIRCNRVRRVGKGVCGLDDSLIDQWLLGALAIFGTVSIVEFAEGLEAVEEEAISILGAFVREWPK
jgi:hypothetical protein